MSEVSGIKACVFDAYGTLLDVNAAARAKRDRLGDRWEPLSALWRAKQLEYTWLRSLMGAYVDFAAVTVDALDFAMEAHGLDDAGLREELLTLYRRLDAYPDAPDVLRAARARGLSTSILSNGSPDMLAEAVAAAGIGDLLDDVLSVDGLRVYKPAPSVYQLACDRFDVAPAEVLFVSSNAWDAAGAAYFGFKVAWLNRAGQPAERMPVPPTWPVKSLTDVARLLD